MRPALQHPEDAQPRDAVVRVLTVDDDRAFLRLVRDLIEATPGFDLLGEAATGEGSILQAAVLCPQVVLMDVRMPGMGGIEAAWRITDAHHSRIAVILMSADPLAIAPALVPPRAVALVGKERLSPRSLRALWDDWTRERRP